MEGLCMLFIKTESKSQRFLVLTITTGVILLGIAAGISWMMRDTQSNSADGVSDVTVNEETEDATVGYYELGVDDTYNYIVNYEALDSVRFPAVGIAQVGAAVNEYYRNLGYEGTPVKISHQDDDGLHIYFTLTSDNDDKVVAYADYRLLDNTIVITEKQTHGNSNNVENNIEIEEITEEGF